MTDTREALATDHAAELADLALSAGQVAGCDDCGLILVPDLVMVEGLANGQQVPDTWRMRRHDGRVAYVYRLPVSVTP